MKQKPTWQKVILKILTYTLVAIIASASTFAVLGERSTALDELEGNTDRYYKELYIVGGGAKNVFLNRLTQEATGKKVIALPIEATALGNLKIQMEVM